MFLHLPSSTHLTSSPLSHLSRVDRTIDRFIQSISTKKKPSNINDNEDEDDDEVEDDMPAVMLLLDTEGTDMWEDSQDSTTTTASNSSSSSSRGRGVEEHVSHRNVGEAKVGQLETHSAVSPQPRPSLINTLSHPSLIPLKHPPNTPLTFLEYLSSNAPSPSPYITIRRSYWSMCCISSTTPTSLPP